MIHWKDRAIAIIAEVGQLAGVSPEEMLGRNRRRLVAETRRRAMYEVRERMGLSYPEIGLVFDRDHSTVIAGCRAERRRRGTK